MARMTFRCACCDIEFEPATPIHLATHLCSWCGVEALWSHKLSQFTSGAVSRCGGRCSFLTLFPATHANAGKED
jgi:hypothetical protein